MRPRAAALALALATAALPVRAGVRPRYGGELRVLLPDAPAEADPARAASPADVALARALHATLLEEDLAGALRPALLDDLPTAEEGGRAFRMRLREGLRFHDGALVTAADVAATLARLAARVSPHAWLASPIAGAAAVAHGRERALAGVEVLSERELRIALAYPFPEFLRALAALPAAVVHVGREGEIVGAGAFRPVSTETSTSTSTSTSNLTATSAANPTARAHLSPPSPRASGERVGERGEPTSTTSPIVRGQVRLVAFDGHHRGRPFADAVTLAGADARAAARAISSGAAELALRGEAGAATGGVATRQLGLVIAVVGHRLGAGAAPLRAMLAGIDRADLARHVRAPAAPLAGLLPESVLAAPAREARPAGGALPARLTLLLPAGSGAARAAAERLQVKLYDRGVRAAIEERREQAGFAARVAGGDHELALVPIWLLSTSPRLALAQVAAALGGPARGAAALERAATADQPGLAALAGRLEDELTAVPLFAMGLQALARPGVEGWAPRPDGSIDLGDVWLMPAGAP